MKKLTAVLLSLILALSLAAPAFAAPAPDAPPEETVPAGITLLPVDGMQESVPISELLNDSSPDEMVSIGIIGGADGPTAIFTTEISAGVDVGPLKAALGGVPGQIGVMVNGEYVRFPDAAPEVTGGRTMVPVRPIVEALGGQAGMADGKVVCEAGGVRLTFTPGSNEVLTEYTGGKLPGDGQMFPMDCAPYIKGGRTYVPVRFLGEILGYEVGWDNDFQTAVLSNLDPKALAAEIDKDFTIMNKVQAAGALSLKPGQSSRTTLKGNMALTMASLEGNKTYKADFGVSALMNDQALNGSATLNVSDALLELLLTQGGLGEDGRAEAQAVLAALKKFEFILNKDGELWAHSDGLDSITGQKDAWFAAGMALGGGFDLSALLAGTEAASVGTALAAMADTGSVMNWYTMQQTMSILELYSDDKFTTSGGTSTLTLGLDELTGVYEDMSANLGADVSLDEVKALFKEYEITIKVDGEGAASVTCKVETAAQSGVPGVRMTMDAAQSGGTGTVTMEINVAGMGKLEMTLTATQKAADGKPMTEPPEGAAIIDTDAPAVLPE